MKHGVCAILMFVTASLARANSPFSPFEVKALTIHDNGFHILITAGSDIATGEGCNSRTMMSLRKDHALFKEMYATLLSAAHTGKPISGWVNGCDATFGTPVLTRLDLWFK
ncbi:MAG: hypothetical protein IV107_18950 [Paucibacter sp.]|nr:hypothetical protein [Roseateles sp.]